MGEVMELDELGERVIACMYDENRGNLYHRRNVIADRAFEAKFRAAEEETPVCRFSNKWGFCTLSEDHKGAHTVVFLGDD